MAPAAPARERDLVARAVGALVRRTRFPVAFGGLERDGAVHVTAIAGARTSSIDGLVVRESRGLGGRSLVERRPRLALDYRTARGITHDYDRAILGEGISTLLSIPVLLDGRARGVLYCGTWTETTVGDVVSRPAFGVAEELARELRANDQARARREAPAPEEAPATLPPALREGLRESYAELRSIAADVGDAAVRTRLAQLEERLRALAAPDAQPVPSAHLSPRETDVLACAALGATNAEIAERLSLREATVKSYLGSAMAKLEASTRHAAVARARRAGLIP